MENNLKNLLVITTTSFVYEGKLQLSAYADIYMLPSNVPLKELRKDYYQQHQAMGLDSCILYHKIRQDNEECFIEEFFSSRTSESMATVGFLRDEPDFLSISVSNCIDIVIVSPAFEHKHVKIMKYSGETLIMRSNEVLTEFKRYLESFGVDVINRKKF